MVHFYDNFKHHNLHSIQVSEIPITRAGLRGDRGPGPRAPHIKGLHTKRGKERRKEKKEKRKRNGKRGKRKEKREKEKKKKKKRKMRTERRHEYRAISRRGALGARAPPSASGAPTGAPYKTAAYVYQSRFSLDIS